MDRIVDWINDRWWGLSDWWDLEENWVRRSYRWLRSALMRILNVSTLSMLGTVASALAAFYTYQASERATSASKQSADVASRSQRFTEQLYRDQLTLSQPSLSIVSGRTFVLRVESPQNSWDQPSTQYGIELTLHNSGGRDARSTVIALTQGNSTYEANIAVLPKDVDVPVRFNSLSYDRPAEGTNWRVALAYVDRAPRHNDEENNVSEGAATDNLSTSCSDVIVVALTATQKEGTDDKHTLVLSPGPSVFIPSKDASGLDFERDARDLRDKVTNRIRETGCN